jgi:GDPmannose 4,6-dehydratase
MKKIIITGVTGQDGSLMADYLLKDPENIVYGCHRRLSVPNHENISHLVVNKNFKKVELDVTDPENVNNVIEKIQPDYYINLAANSFVGNSWAMPVNHMTTNAMAVLFALESIKKYSPHTKFYNAGSSEQFGDVDYWPQDLTHPFKPRSPYGASKCAAHHLVKVYRESYNMYAVQGILFNHEGVRRGEEFVTRKITKGVSRISKCIHNQQKFEPIQLGNIYSKRDWSDAEDFVRGIWMMLNQDQPKDYILSSGETHTIKEFVELAFEHAGIEGCWVGAGEDEKYIIPNYVNDVSEIKSQVLMEVNREFYRPAEVDLLLGDYSEAKDELGWTPEFSFRQLVEKMVDNDLKEV